MQVNTTASLKGKAVFPSKPLIPPLGFSMLDEGLYRANGPFSKHNVAFLNQHAFKSVVCLANDTIDKTTASLIEALKLNVIYSRSLQLERVSVSDAEMVICDVVTCLLDSSVYPVLFIGSSANQADLAVLGYIRRLQGINLVSIFWELELLSMKKMVDLHQFLEHVEVEKFDLAARLTSRGLVRANMPAFLSRLLPDPEEGGIIGCGEPEAVMSGQDDGADIAVELSVENCDETVFCELAGADSCSIPVEQYDSEMSLEAIISKMLFAPLGSAGSPGPAPTCCPLLSQFSSYDPAVSLVDDKDEDD
jgi:hypothetical protein